MCVFLMMHSLVLHFKKKRVGRDVLRICTLKPSCQILNMCLFDVHYTFSITSLMHPRYLCCRIWVKLEQHCLAVLSFWACNALCSLIRIEISVSLLGQLWKLSLLHFNFHLPKSILHLWPEAQLGFHFSGYPFVCQEMETHMVQACHTP